VRADVLDYRLTSDQKRFAKANVQNVPCLRGAGPQVWIITRLLIENDSKPIFVRQQLIRRADALGYLVFKFES